MDCFSPAGVCVLHSCAGFSCGAGAVEHVGFSSCSLQALAVVRRL